MNSAHRHIRKIILITNPYSGKPIKIKIAHGNNNGHATKPVNKTILLKDIIKNYFPHT
jgi:hypothetical protein